MTIKLAINNSYAGAGKDSVANYLCERHGFVSYSLSDGIYEIAHKYYGVPEGKKPPRELLHHIGESLRKYDMMLWINNTLRRIEEDGHDRVVITDVRKLLEHAVLKEKGFINIMIDVKPETALERLKARDGEENVNEELVLNSELESQLRPLKDTMRVFDNSDSFEETCKEIDAYIKMLESRGFEHQIDF